jgi:hypothetical protein
LRHSQSEIAFLEKNGPEHFAKMFSSLKKISHKLAMVDEVLHDNLNPTPLGTKKSNSHHLQLTFSVKCVLMHFYIVCVPSMGIWYQRYQIIPEGGSPL